VIGRNINECGEETKMKLNFEPKGLAQNVVYYSICLLLVASMWFHSRWLVDGMTVVAAVFVVAVAGLMLAARGSCRF
jgi:hypothetical protein